MLHIELTWLTILAVLRMGFGAIEAQDFSSENKAATLEVAPQTVAQSGKGS